MTGLTFGWALAQMKSGARVRRQSWSPSLSLSLNRRANPEESEFLHHDGDASWPVKLSGSVAFAEDWEVA